MSLKCNHCSGGKLHTTDKSIRVNFFICSNCHHTIMSDIVTYLNKACNWTNKTRDEIYSYLREDKR